MRRRGHLRGGMDIRVEAAKVVTVLDARKVVDDDGIVQAPVWSSVVGVSEIEPETVTPEVEERVETPEIDPEIRDMLPINRCDSETVPQIYYSSCECLQRNNSREITRNNDSSGGIS